MQVRNHGFKHNSCYWLRHYATSRKFARSSPDEVYFFNVLNPSAALCPGVDSASKRNEYQECLWG
jgi:hypothetical protein